MTIFGEGYFFILLILLSLPAIALGVARKNIKYYGFAVSILIVWMALRDNTPALLSLIGYCVYEFILLKGFLAFSKRKPHNGPAYMAALTASLIPLIIWKISLLGGHSILGFLGLSYMTFKTAQIIIEIYDGLIKEVKAFDFIYELIFFPCISSGPIDRSRRFVTDLDNTPSREDYLELVGDGLFKICRGLVYKFIFAGAAFQVMTWLGGGDSVGSSLIYMYSYGIYLFFDFAGYSQMAAGTSYIFGVRTPDNFNKPFLATDMKDFWDRWHMTLSYWFRDYLFSRLMMRSIRGKWFKDRLTGATLGFIINMAVMGIWHGLTFSYIGYGLYHGVLLAGTEYYQKKSKFHKKHKKEKWYIFVSWFITMNLVFFGFFIFSGKLAEILNIGK